jgi:transcription-repair coupling factor (superfamily II helicase)
MSLTGLLAAVRTDPGFDRVVAAASSGTQVPAALDVVGPSSLRPFLVGALASTEHAARTVLAVVATTREADDLAAALAAFLPRESIAVLPSWETLPHERLSPRADTVGRRLAVLRRLRHPDEGGGRLRVVVAPIRAILQPIVRGLGDLEPVRITRGSDIDLDDVLHDLVLAGYVRTELVERRGEFAVRGGILDLFPPTLEHPLRVELWGDTVEEIRAFTVADQRSIESADDASASIDEVWAPPCRELLLTDEVRERAAALADAHPEIAELCRRIADGQAPEGMESLAPVLGPGMETVLDVVPSSTLIVVGDPERVRARSHDLIATSEEFLDAAWQVAGDGGQAPVDLREGSYRSLAQIRDVAADHGLPWWTLSPFAIDDELLDARVDADVVSPAFHPATAYQKDHDQLMRDLRSWVSHDWRIVLTSAGHGPAQRMAEVLADEGIAARVVESIDSVPTPGVVHLTTATLDHGVVAELAKVALITETDASGDRGSTKDMRRMPSRRRGGIDPVQLAPGDYVVHDQHGVGRYVEMVSREVAGATREYLVVEYAPAKRGAPPDRLFVPMDQLDQLTRYVGGEAPTLHRMGGADWVKTKGRARKAVKEIAAGLIRLYSARMAEPGHAFAADTPWQHELEDAFPYVETPDQLACIDEVKRDMERPIPMDRLICGDVGYGKTEIAVRAAFKAVQDGKQVAVLVPTTLLVQQHTSTFAERYAQFPLRLASLSRFQTDKQARAVLDGLADGSIDVVVGTHRLFGSDVTFKDLGLVIVDEEQRFGVEHKERLKAVRANVDVLTMSATPIPRTLEMAVTGIREMSTIQTPPEERHPVLTYVGPYEQKQVTAAIRRELLREGQVFYLHNRVESIDAAAERLRELVPEARIAVAHGQMGEHQLEQVIVDFWERRFDVLVCTTIVESGIDVANANTLVVERADRFGLSQLHQIRGRVGRGRERAYAYFLYPQDMTLTDTAHDRLATIAQNTDLGAGMAVAMKDLEIRGAGNLLGGEQSGHIAGVGFDLYVRMVGEAVAEFRGDAVEDEPEVRIELPIDAHIPHTYVSEERLRLEAYKRLAQVKDAVQLEAARDELLDRYGVLPQEVVHLLEVAAFRILAREAGLTEVAVAGKHIRFGPVELRESQELKLLRLYPGTLVKAPVRTILVPRPATARIGGVPLRDLDLLAWARELVSTILLGDPARLEGKG